MDYRSRILAAIDTLHAQAFAIDAEAIAWSMRELRVAGQRKVARELRAMAKEGLVVYDRKASGWRRA